MAKTSAQIALQTSDFASIQKILKDCLRIDEKNENSMLYGMNIMALDCSYEVGYATNFMKERGIVEPNPLGEFYNSDECKIVVFITLNIFTMFNEFLPAIADGIAKSITRRAKVKGVISINDVPFSVFDNGKQIAKIHESYDQYD